MFLATTKTAENVSSCCNLTNWLADRWKLDQKARLACLKKADTEAF
jgi:hypothetical protein